MTTIIKNYSNLIDHNSKTIDALERINKLGGRSLIVVSNKTIFKRHFKQSLILRKAITES